MKPPRYAKPAAHQAPRVTSTGICPACRETRYKGADGVILAHQTARLGGRVVQVQDCPGAGRKAMRAMGESVLTWEDV